MVKVSDAGLLAGSPGLVLWDLESCLSPGKREDRRGKEKESQKRQGGKNRLFKHHKAK